MTNHQMQWRNRITRYAEVPPDSLLANPRNWRIHPQHQQEALRGVIAEVGYVDPVLVQEGTDVVIDGHLRVTLALRDGIPTIPVAYVDLTDEEAALVLATFDPIASLAVADREQVDALLREVHTDDVAIQHVLSMLASTGDQPTAPAGGHDDAGALEHWQSRFEVVVECADEDDQRHVYERLMAEGYRCRILTM